MHLLNDSAIADKVLRRETFRITNVSSKLTRNETERLDALARSRGRQRGEFIRELILAELSKATSEPPSLELTEITALRLLITNLLRPLTTGQKLTPDIFDGIVAEVKKRKRTAAAELRQDLERA